MSVSRSLAEMAAPVHRVEADGWLNTVAGSYSTFLSGGKDDFSRELSVALETEDGMFETMCWPKQQNGKQEAEKSKRNA